MNPTTPEIDPRQQESPWNMSDVLAIIQHHAPFAIAVNKYVTPLWYVVGLVGNVISALIWSNQRLRTCNTAAFYLTSLALADFSYLALHMFYELENPWFVHTLNVPVWCEVWNTLYMAAQYFCVVLVCAFTVERFLSVCHPFRSERFGRTRSPSIILALLSLSLALASPQAYFWEVGRSDECHVRHSELQQQSFYSIWSWCTDMLVFGALPLLVLLLNVGVLRRIRHVGRLRFQDCGTHSAAPTAHLCRQQHAARRTSSRRDTHHAATSLIDTTSSSSSSSSSHHNFTATTVTLLWVSFYLIFTTLPVTIVFAIQTVIPLGSPMPVDEMGADPTWRRYLTYYTARVVIKEIGMSHHVGNVFIYLATSRRFRRQVRKRMHGEGAAPYAPKHWDLSSTNGAISLNTVRTEQLHVSEYAHTSSA